MFDRFTKECLKELDRKIYKYESVSLFRCFDNLSCESIVFPVGINTSSVTSMYYMFNGCSSLSSLDLSTFNSSNVTNMAGMFSGCNSFSSLDLSTFDTSSVGPDGVHSGCTDMFKECSKLREVYLKDERIKFKLPSGISVKTK